MELQFIIDVKQMFQNNVTQKGSRTSYPRDTKNSNYDSITSASEVDLNYGPHTVRPWKT